MVIKEDRVTIFTKNTGKYSGIALILDLTRSINHTYGSSVAAHPIEGSGNTIADHQYLKNIKIQISGHVSNGVKVPGLSESSAAFELTREDTALTSELHDIRNDINEDVETINAIPSDPEGTTLTKEEADLLNKYADIPNTYSEGQTLSESDLTVAQVTSQQNAQLLDTSVVNAIQTTEEENQRDKQSSISNGQRRVYSNNQLNKQLDALILLENIRDNRLLVDVLTPNRLYTNMTMNFNLPRNMRQGTALEVNLVFEEQRFNEIDVESVPYSKDSKDLETSEKQDEKAKEVIDPEVLARSAEYRKSTVIEDK